MAFDQNLFISYAHLDDRPLNEGEKGWITRFHTTLNAILSMRMGREAKIWRDPKLHGNDVFSDEIAAKFLRSATLMCIIFPSYLNSEWCRREAHEFCESAERSGGLVVGSKSRVFKVIKTPVDEKEAEALPPHMKDLLGFEFFLRKDEEHTLELDPDLGPEYSQLYRQKIAVLAQDIAQLLKELQSAGRAGGGETDNGEATRQAPVKPAVYLAECSDDRKPQRELLEGELKRLGYPVLPDKRLPAVAAGYLAAAEGLLTRCALSIHLVGEKYGAVPDGPTDKSVSILQNELAVARCRAGGLRRLIWLPLGTGSEEERQKKFIERLHTDAEAQFGADVIAGDIEELRDAILHTLRMIEHADPDPSRAAVETQTSAKLVYFICDEKDRGASVPVRKLCRYMDFEIALPAFEGDASAVRPANQSNLANCDLAVVFYGAGDEAWKRTVDNELKKMAGYRGGKPRPPVLTYLAEPRTSDKQDLINVGAPRLIDGLGGFAEQAMAAALRAATGAGTAA
jgi:hypothetical protein